MHLGKKSKKEKQAESEISQNVRVFVCDYGHRHIIGKKCNCINIYKALPLSFREALRDLGYKVLYNSQITPEMQEKYLKQKQN